VWTSFIADLFLDTTPLIFLKPILFIAENYKYKYHLALAYPDVVTDEFGNIGFWTLIYNQVRILFFVCNCKILLCKCIAVYLKFTVIHVLHGCADACVQ